MDWSRLVRCGGYVIVTCEHGESGSRDIGPWGARVPDTRVRRLSTWSVYVKKALLGAMFSSGRMSTFAPIVYIFVRMFSFHQCRIRYMVRVELGELIYPSPRSGGGQNDPPSPFGPWLPARALAEKKRACSADTRPSRLAYRENKVLDQPVTLWGRGQLGRKIDQNRPHCVFLSIKPALF